MSTPERVLTVGLIGLRHLHPRAYMASFRAAGGFEVVAAADADEATLGRFAGEFGVRAYRDWRELIEREPLDLAAIFLPHADCPEAAAACAGRGLHVMVEKPMAASSAALREAIAAARQAGVLLTAPYVWRCHPVTRQMRLYREQGILGRVVGCEGRCAAGRVHRYIEGGAAWMLDKRRSGGGPMHNLGVHWIDLFRWLLDDEVVAVSGKNIRVNERYDIEDNSFALLEFARGAVAVLDISYTVPDAYPHGRDLYLGLRGTSGVLSWSPSFEGVRERLVVCSDHAAFGAAPRREIQFELEPAPGYAGVMGVEYLRQLGVAIRSGTPAPVPAEDGLRALEVVEAIYESAATGRTVGVAARGGQA
jgi:predicted dehydrogenase